MGLSGIFKQSSYIQEIETLQAQVAEMQSFIDSVGGKEAFADLTAIKGKVEELERKKAEVESQIEDAQKRYEKKEKEYEKQEKEIEKRKQKIISLDDDIVVQEFGLYHPKFAFTNSTLYKEALADIRQEQKDLIKLGKAVVCETSWTVQGSASKGKKAVSDLSKLLLRAFNTECDDIIDNVKYTNYEASLKRIRTSADSISKLGNMFNIEITNRYIRAKEEELKLAFEFAQKKQEEKEAQRELKAQEREAAKLQKEIAEQRKAIYKEQSHYQKALRDVRKQLEGDPENADLAAKQESILAALEGIDKSLTDIDYREANQKAGYVYVISNIGAFGEGVYKIGMTRRLDPQERVDELGDASVPFNFDVHAMIFSDDAPALEAALHRAFEDKKVNMVNTRREFFKVSLDEIKDVIKANFDKTVEFVDIADAEQFRISEKMREEMQSKKRQWGI